MDSEGRARILVVEDEESYRDALELSLTKEGYDVDLASTGPEAIALFERVRPDLVLLDVMLPGMAGTEVCRRLRAIADVPVIIVSALDAEADVVHGLEMGAADYLTKPYHFRELVARVQAVLRRVNPLPGVTAPEQEDSSGASWDFTANTRRSLALTMQNLVQSEANSLEPTRQEVHRRGESSQWNRGTDEASGRGVGNVLEGRVGLVNQQKQASRAHVNTMGGRLVRDDPRHGATDPRGDRSKTDDEAETGRWVEAGPVVIDFYRREVQVNGRVVLLSRREFDLLAMLLSPPGHVRTREELIDRIWAGKDLADTRTLDTHIRRLRVKIEPDPSSPRHLVTVRGVGFRFDEGE